MSLIRQRKRVPAFTWNISGSFPSLGSLYKAGGSAQVLFAQEDIPSCIIILVNLWFSHLEIISLLE